MQQSVTETGNIISCTYSTSNCINSESHHVCFERARSIPNRKRLGKNKNKSNRGAKTST